MTRARAQAPAAVSALPVAWEHQFPDGIEWYIRTSAGILLVRSGKDLTAIDGVDGRQLWSLPNLDIGSEWILDAWGRNNIMEVPDLSILLINRASLSPGAQPSLLGVDLWSGKIEWVRPALPNLWQVLPLPDSDRVLLLTTEDERDAVTATWGSPFPVALDKFTAASVLEPEMVLLDPRTGNFDWTALYPDDFLPEYVEIRESNAGLYLFAYSEFGHVFLGRLDPSSGRALWKFRKDLDPDVRFSPAPEFDSNNQRADFLKSMSSETSPTPSEFIDSDMPSSLQFFDGGPIIAGTGLYALDPGARKPVWKAEQLGKIAGLIVDQGLMLGSGEDGAFALDAKAGGVRWRFQSEGQATNPPLYDRDDALVFCDAKNLVELDAATGKVLRRTALPLGSEPLFIRRIGPQTIIAAGKKQAVMLNLASGESSPVFPKPDLEFLSAVFWMSWKSDAGFSDPPADLERELEARWPKISAEADRRQEAFNWHGRIESFLNTDAGPLYANQSSFGNWTFRRVNPTTGAMIVFDLTGYRPDANPDLGLVYMVEKSGAPAQTTGSKSQPAPESLRAFQMPAN